MTGSFDEKKSCSLITPFLCFHTFATLWTGDRIFLALKLNICTIVKVSVDLYNAYETNDIWMTVLFGNSVKETRLKITTFK